MASAVDALSAVLEDALSADLDDASAEDLLGTVRALAQLRSRADGLEAAVLRRVDAREAHRVEHSPTSQAWLRHHLHLDTGDARRRLNRSRILCRLDGFCAALAEGSISAGHVDALGRAWARLGPDTVSAAQDTLLALAKASSPEQVKTAAERLVQVIEPDETLEARAYRQRAERHLRIAAGFDGTWTLDGVLDPADGAVVKTAIDALAVRRPLPDGTPDPRTRGQRAADALVEMAGTVLGQGDTPVVNGIRPHVTLVLDLPTLRAELSSGHPAEPGKPGNPLVTVFTHSFGAASLHRLTCGAEITPVLATSLGVPLALGRTQRLAVAAQIRMMLTRDGGCITPGCTNTRLQAHHVIPWSRGGLTDLDEMVLLCERCHHLLHEDHWELEPDPRRPGLFQFRPPGGGPPVPAVHAVDRHPGATIPLPFPADPVPVPAHRDGAGERCAGVAPSAGGHSTSSTSTCTRKPSACHCDRGSRDP